MAKELEVVIGEDGRARFIYDDDLADLIPAGYQCAVQRASYVEPHPSKCGWIADMTPTRDNDIADVHPVLLGRNGAFPATHDGMDAVEPFATRAEALAAEVAWLRTWAGV